MIKHVGQDKIRIVRESGIFDEEWYVENYPDVKLAQVDPITHYLWLGEKLGRSPSPQFSPAAYLTANPDVAGSDLGPFLHYVTAGQFENRSLGTPVEERCKPAPTKKAQGRIYFREPSERAARVIAFHLPQFHSFPENNEWWGEGFTEWTNVKPARPQFAGHYQPHVPHPDVGYYDLSESGVFRRQIDMARSHGISGFCFYYYWFDGKRLMESAIEGYLADRSLDFPFCLCWANENWTRRWDGLDSEVLVAQNHSPQDDLECIADLARYIKDERYIRVAGRPLVLVYRPSLLPDASATAARWREWCRNNGIGEIYLAYTQSFEREDPSIYGFDAAIEFPPNNTGPLDLTQSIVSNSSDFSGRVYDWRSLAHRSVKYDIPDYNLFRATCPGWDNTARRKNSGSILINNSPDEFEDWMKRAVREAIVKEGDPSARLIFVNAWNEWAEGAHLEPDLQDGYAYLNAVRHAIELNPAPPKVAVAVHAFYPEVLPEILSAVDKLPGSLFIFITTTQDKFEAVESIMTTQKRQYEVIVCDNRGRDVLPFMKVLARLSEYKFEYVAKVHTKKSLHREDGAQWRAELYNSVIGREAFYRSVIAMECDKGIGLLGPAGHFVSMDTYLGSNKDRIWKYAEDLGIRSDDVLQFGFFAGTMFIARVSAIEPILRLGIQDDDFEEERGQIDGTLAHVLERVLALSVASKRYRIGYSDSPYDAPTINTRYGFA